MTPSQAQTELSILLSDTLTQVSGDRLSQAITQAYRDPWVATYLMDTTSLVFSSSTYSYALPATMTVLDEILYQPTTSLGPVPISADLWQVVNGQIVFNMLATSSIPTGQQLILRGKYKLQVGDTIPATNWVLQNYVVNMAAWIVLKQVAFSRALSFLKNDTTMAELIGLRNQVQQDMLGYRSQLQMAYVGS